MQDAPAHPRDPLPWSAALALAFLALCLVRLAIPSKPYFDEVHYLPAARALLLGSEWLNREHPMLGKELMALGIALLGDGPWGWRLPSALAGALALFASMRALWFASLSRFATLAYGALLASGFLLFVHARIAMLDGFMLCFLAIAAWQFAAACREPERGRPHLACTGLALGLAIACKWTAAPVAVLPGLAFLTARWAAGRRRLVRSRRGAPVPGVSLAEAFLWLGLVPLAVYAVSYLPAYLIAPDEMARRGMIGLHAMMIAEQEGVIQPHPYQSTWPEWLFNVRAIWYLYEPVDGAQRGILLIGNPLTMLAGLPALVWCAWAGVRGRHDALAVALVFAASLGLWLFAHKPVQFYYHYLVPSMALLAALALALDAWWRRGHRALSVTIVAASCAVFAWFYPILSAAPLAGEQAFNKWMWLDTWR
jgi:dolichyl-phosphate-mannose--protein O-mannosyl transferase